MGKCKVNWPTLEAEYITSNISQRQLADKYGITLAAVSKEARKGGWVGKRKEHVRSVVARATKATAREQARQLTTLMRATDTLSAAINQCLQDADQLYRHIITISDDNCTYSEERVYKKMDTVALRNFTLAIKELTALTRDYYNIPTPAQAEAQRIAAERLALEQRKAAQNEQEDRTIQVVIAGELEGYSV